MRMRKSLAIVSATLTISQVRPHAHAEPWDGPDKPMHLVAGTAIAANGTVLMRIFELDADEATLAGLTLGVVAGAAKEGLDALGLGEASAADFAWTALGALLGAGVSWLISR